MTVHPRIPAIEDVDHFLRFGTPGGHVEFLGCCAFTGYAPIRI